MTSVRHVVAQRGSMRDGLKAHLRKFRPIYDPERVAELAPTYEVVGRWRRDDLKELDEEGCDLVELEGDRR